VTSVCLKDEFYPVLDFAPSFHCDLQKNGFE